MDGLGSNLRTSLLFFLPVAYRRPNILTRTIQQLLELLRRAFIPLFSRSPLVDKCIEHPRRPLGLANVQDHHMSSKAQILVNQFHRRIRLR